MLNSQGSDLVCRLVPSLFSVFFALAPFSNAQALNGSSPWLALRRACDAIGVPAAGSGLAPLECSFSNPTGVAGAEAQGRAVLRLSADPLIAAAQESCRRESERLRCDELRADVAGDSVARAKLRVCTPEGVCEHARAMASGSHVGTALGRCALTIAENALSAVMAPARAWASASECFNDTQGKVQLLGRGPWMSGLSDDQRRAMVARLSCAEVNRLRQRRLEAYVQQNRLDADGLRRAIENDGTLTSEQADHVVRSLSGLSASDAFSEASAALGRLNRGFESMSCYKPEVQGEIFCLGWSVLAAVPPGAEVLARLARITGNARIARRLNREPNQNAGTLRPELGPEPRRPEVVSTRDGRLIADVGGCGVPPCPESVTFTPNTFAHARTHLGLTMEQQVYLEKVLNARAEGRVRNEGDAAWWLDSRPPRGTSRDNPNLDPTPRPFRKGRDTSLFPDGVSPESIARELPRLELRRTGKTSQGAEYRTRYGDNEYSIWVCDRPSCQTSDTPPLSFGPGDVISVYPVCGPTIRKLVPLATAKRILLSSPAPMADQFYESVPCP